MNNIVWQTKRFNQLTTLELYELLRLREQVFIIEQNCIYPDLDNNDKKAIHVLGSIGSEVIAYTRLFKSGDYFDTASIGRVVVNPKFRRLALGKQLMQKSISALKDLFKEDTITISAQCYLIEFYKSLGFLAVGDEYLEDNIPHVKMIRG